MKRSRKSLPNTPVQKTTLLNYFTRTPSATPSTPSVSSIQPPESSTCPKQSKSETSNNVATPGMTPLSNAFQRSVAKEKDVKCPGCKLSVCLKNLNDHLDNECVSTTNRIKESIAIEKPPPILEFSPDKKLKGSLYSQHTVLHTNDSPFKEIFSSVPQPSSSSKISVIRKEEISISYNNLRLSDTDVKVHKERLMRKKNHSEVKRRLFDENAKPKYEMPYYLENFLFSLKSTFDEPLYRHLFTEEDSLYYNSFLSLSSDAKKLYVRLFTRKYQWRRKEKIKYDDISSDLTPALDELCSSSLIIPIDELQDMTLMIQLLTQPELKQLFKELKIPFNNKGNSVQDILKYCKNQPCLKGVLNARSMPSIIMKKARQYLSACYKLKEEPRRVYLRMCMLSSLHQRQEEEEEKGQQQQMFTMLQVTIGRKSFPSYLIRRQRPIFKLREHLIKYEEAVLLETQVRDAMENQKWDTVLELTESIASALPEDFNSCPCDLELPLFLRRFTAGAVRVYILNKRIEALQRLKKYAEAVDLITALIAQENYLLTHRGHWYERLSLNIEQHLKDPRKALEFIRNGLSDSWVSPSHKLALSQRATRICQTPKLKETHLSLLADLPLLTPAEPTAITITARSLPSEIPGRKSVFIRGDSQATLDEGDVTLCSVEELVLQHYLENGYSHGLHGEGSTVWSVIGLLFWDVIYQSDVADVFLSPFQAYPLDFDSLDFFPNREQSILTRLECLKSWSVDELIAHVTSIWNENHGSISLVSWDRFHDVDHVVSLIQCIDPSVLAALSQRLLSNYRHYRSGFPDLTVWNPQEKKWRIVEVKSPNDRLSTKQILWLDFLVSIGVEAEVCHVEAIGIRKMGGKVQPTPRKRGGKEKSSPNSGTPLSKKAKLDSETCFTVEDSDEDFVV